MPDHHALERLIADGFVRPFKDHFVPTPRWHAAVARAAVALMLQGEELDDLRVPVAWALSEVYGTSSSDDEVVEMVAVMTPLTGVSSALPPEGPRFDHYR